MKKPRIQWVPFIATAVSFAITLVAVSAPFLPPPPRVSDETLSLARVEKVRLEIAPLAAQLANVGLSAKRIEADWREKLTAAGIKVANDDPQAPRLRLQTKATDDEDLPGGTGFSSYLKLYQRVHVPRLNRKLEVPTFTYLMGGIENAEDLAAATQQSLDIVIIRFIEQVELAGSALDDLENY